MDVLFRQLRTKYPDEEGSRRSSPSRDQKLPPQKTEPFKGERRSQSWIRRQFSKQMNQDSDSSAERDYQTALAAAAFAVKSLEELRMRDQRMRHQGPDASSTKNKIKPDDNLHAPQPRIKSIKFSDEISKANLDAQDKIVRFNAETSEKPPEKTLGLVPSIKKQLSFADTIPIPQPQPALPAEKPIGTIPSVRNPLNLNKEPSQKQETSGPKLDAPPHKEPKVLPQQNFETTGMGDTEADEWERSEMSRIKDKYEYLWQIKKGNNEEKKYEKLNATILEWENKKKRKAKIRLDKTEAELDKRRAKAMQHYRSELERIEGIASGARSQAIQNRRNEELKVREKANKIRLTGRLPATCLCC